MALSRELNLGSYGCGGATASISPAQLKVEDNGGKEVRDCEEVQCNVDRREGAGE
mgnify:CR=1 FL=1